MLLGAHQSIAGGVHTAFARADSDGCRALQVFVKPSRQWRAKPLTDGDVAAFRAAQADSDVQAVMAHDSYLINLAAMDDGLLDRSLSAFADELERCERLGIPLLVFHPGAPRDKGRDWGLRQVAESLNTLLAATRGYAVRPCLENTAGQGSTVGSSFEEIRAILDGVAEPERVGVCFDTQHAFAAGYDLSAQDGYDAMWDDFDRLVGLDRLAAFHLNDSKKGLGERVDRHANIGQGALGLEPFRWLVRDPRFTGLPAVLETPSAKGDHPYREELALLESLRA